MSHKVKKILINILTLEYFVGFFIGIYINYNDINSYVKSQKMILNFDKQMELIGKNIEIGHKYGINFCIFPFIYIIYGKSLKQITSELHFKKK